MVLNQGQKFNLSPKERAQAHVGICWEITGLGFEASGLFKKAVCACAHSIGRNTFTLFTMNMKGSAFSHKPRVKFPFSRKLLETYFRCLQA